MKCAQSENALALRDVKAQIQTKPRKRGPPCGLKGGHLAQKARTDGWLKQSFSGLIDACPDCGGALKEGEDVRERYEEEIVLFHSSDHVSR
jgi:hypothetical protein